MDDHSTVLPEVVEELGFDVNALVEQLKEVPDARHAQGKRYTLAFLLAVIILAKLTGHHKPSAIAQWAKLRQQPLAKAFSRQRETVPALNTIRRTLSDSVVASELLSSYS